MWLPAEAFFSAGCWRGLTRAFNVRGRLPAVSGANLVLTNLLQSKGIGSHLSCLILG